MKIAVISDTHNNHINLIKALDLIKQNKLSALIHCGDITSIESFEIILNNFDGPIYVSLGNGDSKKDFIKFVNQKIYIFDNFGEVEIDNNEIAITHFPNVAFSLTKKLKYKYIFYGHTHKPWIEKFNHTTILNPGNLAGLIYSPTFVICDLENLGCQLIRL